MNMLKGKGQRVTGEGMRLSVDGGHGTLDATVDGMGSLAEAEYTVGIRPEHLVLSDTGTLAGTVITTEMLGAETILFTNLQSGEIVTASIPGIRSVRPGATVRFSVDRRFVHVFDDRGLTLPPLRSWQRDYVDE
jgi:ABC-type sugar transport system ATPase subunit